MECIETTTLKMLATDFSSPMGSPVKNSIHAAVFYNCAFAAALGWVVHVRGWCSGLCTLTHHCHRHLQ